MDPNGNLTGITNPLDPNRDQGFGYDALDRLTEAHGSYGELGYTYDEVGNRLSRTRNGIAEPYTYAADSNAGTKVSVSDRRAPRNFIQHLLNVFYRALADRFKAVADAISAEAGRLRVQAKALRDAAGIEEGQAQAREAEATELLAEASEAREEATGLRTEADAFIARVQTAEALAAEYRALLEHPPSAQIATHYLYDPAGRLLGEYDEAGQVEREYVYLEGMPLALMAPNGIYYYHTDHLGTPEALTDQGQAIVWQAHHDPFGQASVTTQAVINNLPFPGQYFDAETGLYYNYFRDYDPSIGRYIQSDPIGPEGGINTYEYALSNPIRIYDPFGLEPNQGCVARVVY